jgi:hypothetical protein
LANKIAGILGFYILSIHEDRPEEIKFIIKWSNKLSILNTEIHINYNPETHYKEMIVSYKTIFINFYNIMVLDISSETAVE